MKMRRTFTAPATGLEALLHDYDVEATRVLGAGHIWQRSPEGHRECRVCFARPHWPIAEQRCLSSTGYLNGKGGREPKAFCLRGHDLSVTRRIRPNGQRECGACAVARKAKQRLARQERKRQAVPA